MTDAANILQQTTLTVGSGDAAREIAVITRLGPDTDKQALV